MEALLLQDGAYVNDRYEELQGQRRQSDQNGPVKPASDVVDCDSTSELSDEERQQLEHWRIVQRAKALDAKGPTPQLNKKFLVLQDILEKFQTAEYLTTMPSCVLSPGLADEVPVELEDGGNVWSVFYQLFQLFEELLGMKSDSMGAERVCLSASDRATVIVAYVALSLKWGRLSYLLKGVKLLLENDAELSGVRLESLLPLFRELASASIERPQVANGEEDQPCGYLMSFGKGDHGKLGHGQCVHVSCQEGNCTENKTVPTMIAATRDVLFRKIDSLSTHSIAITSKGDAMAWGNGDKYRLGHGSSTKEYAPRPIEFLKLKGRVHDLACGLGHTLALTESGELFAWGNGSNGRLGLGDTNDRSSPTRVVIPTARQGNETEGGPESSTTSAPIRFRHIFCGASHSLGLSWDGRAYAWGKNNQGQCGHGHTNDQWVIQEIESFEDGEEGECVIYAAGGWEHSLFCTTSGRVYSCGCGYKDSRRAGIPPVLGHGDCDRRLKPTLIQALDDAREEIVKVACGWDHSLAVSATGKVYTWGSGTNGKLGHGDEESFDIPTIGDSGRLGHGDNQTRKRPMKIEFFAECGLKPVALAVGDKYNLVLVRDSDAQYESEENEPASIPKTQQRGSCEALSHGTIRLQHGRHRTCQHKKHNANFGNEFGANWVLSVAVGMNSKGNSPTTSLKDPDSASSAALFIAGHVDRLASDYIADEPETMEKRHESKMTETNSKPLLSVLIPFAADTSYESLTALLHLLQWTSSPASSKEKAAGSEKSGSDVSSGLLGTQERMGLALSCLRILQLNLKKSLDAFRLPVQNVGENRSVSMGLFGQVHQLLDSLAGLKGENSVERFGTGTRRVDGAQNLFAIGSAVSQEAACALKMGFVLKRLHKGSRQHEEIITWRLNGSFFHTLLPSAIECLSILLLPVPSREYTSDACVSKTTDSLVLVERILPNLHVMLKMLDEVSWKMHTATDAGNQAHDDTTTPSHQPGFTAQERNWFVDLGDACAVLCGKLSCELFYPLRTSIMESDDDTQQGTYYSLVLSEGRFLRDQDVLPATRAHESSSIHNILEWERLGVFEVEDELVGGKEDSSVAGSLLSRAFESQRFLLQLCDTDFSSNSVSFWNWVAGRLSHVVEITSETQRLLTLVSLDMKEEDGALLRTGICILHDLLRKLTTSSSKSCLLDEFVAVTCGTRRMNSIPVVSSQRTLTGEHGKHIDKAIENLFVRLARVVSSAEASFELKKKALMAWTVPLSVSERGVPSVVALIAKSGIISTMVELLLDEASVLDTHSDLNVITQSMVNDNQEWASQAESKLPTKMSPIKALLFEQTPAQIISVLAWEAFCAIAMQLSKSEHFAELRSSLLLRSAGSTLHDREPLTPRSTSMSPRRRLTLPKKTVISSIDEIIEQMTDGLFVMLEGTKSRLDTLEISSQEYGTLIRPVEETNRYTEKQDYSRVCLFGSPVQFSHSNSYGIGVPKANTCNAESTTSLALSFWVYIEQTGATISNNEVHALSTYSQSKVSSVRLITLSASQVTSESTDSDSDGSLVLFIHDACPDRVSIGLSIKCDGDTNECWCSILVEEHIPRGKWVQIVLVFDKERAEPLQVFVGARRSTLSKNQQSVDHCKQFCLEVFQKSTSWTQMTVGGTADVDALTNVKETNTPESLRLSVLPKKPIHGFSAVVDDVVISRDALTEETIVRMQRNGPVLFRLKQQYIAESHCVKVLRLLCQLFGADEEISREVSPASLPSSGRWIALFTHMLQSTCRDQDLAQVYLCHLLQDVLPRAAPLPGFDVQNLGQNLFGPRLMKITSLEDLFIELNENNQLPATSAIRRQNEALYRTMHQRGILHGKYRGGSSSENDRSSDETTTGNFALRPKGSMRFAAAAHLFQKLCYSPSWGSRIDHFIERSSVVFQGGGRLKEILESEESSTLQLADMAAVVSTIAGYSEEVVNGHRAAVQDAAILPSAIQAYSSPFYSVIHYDDYSGDQVRKVQALIAAMLSEETRDALRLPARKDILAKCHNDVFAVNAIDQRIGSVVHQRARVLRVLTTALLRGKYTTTRNSWHDFLFANTAACDDLLQIASSSLKQQVVTMLGPDVKIAMKNRRLRIFIKEVLRGGKHRRDVPLTVSLADLESLQWRLWEEFTTRPSSVPLVPWWQNSESDGKLTLEVVGGDVELSGLKVKALEHFPTVRLTQASICASSGLWFFEVIVLTDGLMQIGYVDGDFTADPLQGQGVGDHTNSWAFDGFRCKKWNVNSYDYGEQWKADDVVGVLLDTDRMEISYFLNGKFLGVAFLGIPITSSSRMCPAASLNVHQSAEFHFGTINVESSNEATSVGGFKYLPALDNDDQTRLRPIIAALDTSNVDSPDTKETKEKDSSEDWSSSSDSDTGDGEIALEGSESLSGLSRMLDSGSRDARTADQNDEENRQRRRDLIEGLTGLGFPLEWATRCATETRLSMDETGAVAWILEQMEKEIGLDGASRLLTRSTFNDDGMIHLPNLVVSHSADTFAAEVGEILSNSELDDRILNVPAFHPSNVSLSGKLDTTPAEINAFIEADKDDQYSDDTTSEAFQSDLYRQRQIGLQALSDLATTSEGNALNSKRGVDDLLPLSIVVDTTAFVAYSRQAFTSLLLLALRDEGQEAVYRMVQRLVSSEESSARLRRLLRIGIGLDTMDAVFELGYISDNLRSERSLRLQKAVAALFKYEAQIFSGESSPTENPSERSPFLSFFCQEMLSQCDRGLSFTRSKQSSKSVNETRAIQAEAAWFAWVSGVVIGFVEDQVSGASSLSEVKAETQISAFVVSLFSSSSFAEKLLTIASNPSTALKAWKYVAFRLMTRIQSVIRARDTSAEFLASSQLTNLTELFTLRCRREMHSRVFYTDVTSALFALLVCSSAHVARTSGQDKRQQSENQWLSLRVNNYSSAHVTISWNQTSLPSDFDSLTDASTAENKADINAGVVFLRVARDNPQLTDRNLTAKNTVNKKWHSVRASVAFEEGVHSWQVRLDTCVSKNIFIGVCTADACMENYVGSDAYGYGFLANKAIWHNKAKLNSYGEIFKQGDVIQVTLDCHAKTLAFSRNGEYLGIAATNMRAGTNRSDNEGNCKWYPAFSMYNKDDKVTLIPPPAAVMFTTKEGRPQNTSTFELIEGMQNVLMYQSLLEGMDSAKLFEKSFEEFDGWRRGEILFRDISLGQVIAIDNSKSATDKYGLAYGDTVFTSKGQCTVLGEYRHELWYEVDEGGSSSLYRTSSTPQLASWSLSTCREMLDSPDEYPVHRHHKYKLELENSEPDSVVEIQGVSADTTEPEEFSFKSFVDAQVEWSENGVAAEADAKLIAELDAIASSQACSSALMLSFADISTALLFGTAHGSNQTIARIGLLLHVNRCLYNVVRLAIPRNIFATSLGVSESSACLAKPNTRKEAPTGCTEYQLASPVAALLNSPHWTLDDPSAFPQIAILAARLLFSSQKEKLIEEELHRTKTGSRTLESLQEPSENEDGVDVDLPVIKISYPLSRGIPFWEYSSALLKRKRHFCLPVSTETSVFVQLVKQLAAQDARQWRRSSSQPFEAIPISQTFQVRIAKQLTESFGEVGKDELDNDQQQDEDDEDQQLHQPSSKQTAKYLNLLENAVREIQSPSFPLFAPVQGRVIGEPRQPLQLDVNLDLFSPSALARSRVQTSQLFLWYFCFGQILGIAWRSNLLLPLQFLSKSLWDELVAPVDPFGNESARSSVRETAIRAIRDGLFSIIPSRCVALLSGSNPSLQNVFQTWMSAMSFVLEIADALADGRDHPDSCYPVVVSIGLHSSRLHLPAYSSAQTLRQKLLLAMTNIPFV
ncbi:Concanavalin A-like lectin/glucanase domain [Phytophthora cactorum]|nr:Concanavalin A-like lectin/glucanase domain [Phytophthora cactorum]